MDMAEKYLIKQAQKEAFSEEIFNLSNGLPLDKESRILKYTPVIPNKSYLQLSVL